MEELYSVVKMTNIPDLFILGEKSVCVCVCDPCDSFLNQGRHSHQGGLGEDAGIRNLGEEACEGGGGPSSLAS